MRLLRPVSRSIALWLLLCFTGNLLWAAAPSGAAVGGEAVLSYKGGKLPAELVAIAGNKELIKRRAKALYALVLLRLAHVFVANKGQTPSDAQASEAMAPLTQISLVDTALDIAEFTAASVIAKATEQMLLKKYPATTMPAKMLTKVKSYGPVFLAWAAVNGIEAQVREGKWSEGFKWSLVKDLAVRVGHELLTLVAVTVALKVLGYPFGLLAKVAEKALAKYATLKLVASAVGMVASRILTFANAAGWIWLAVSIFHPLAKKAYAAEEVRQLRRLAGQQVRYRTQLTDLLLSRQGERVAAFLQPGDARILAHAYISDRDPLAPSKYELLVQLGDANNQIVEERLKEMKSLLIENRKDRVARKTEGITKRQARIDELKGEIRSVFGNGKAAFLDRDGLETIGETNALRREMGNLAGVERQAGNLVMLPPRLDELVVRTEGVLKSFLQKQNDPRALEKVDAVRGMMEEEVVSLESYCRKRLAQIEKLTSEFPTEGEAMAEAGINEAAFEAVNELAEPDKPAPRRQGGAGFEGIERE